jgi:hypothetical protein
MCTVCKCRMSEQIVCTEDLRFSEITTRHGVGAAFVLLYTMVCTQYCTQHKIMVTCRSHDLRTMHAEDIEITSTTMIRLQASMQCTLLTHICSASRLLLPSVPAHHSAVWQVTPKDIERTANCDVDVPIAHLSHQL